MEKKFVKGNEAMAEAAVRAGCRFYAGYPITPQNEIPEYLSWRLPEMDGDYIQGESEVAASYMLFGASMTGTRCMTSSSGCGLALKAEGIGYITGARLPAVIINVGRGGPGCGQILPAQADYHSATKAPSNGGAKCFMLAPATVQEAVDLVYEAFDIADKYRCICYVLVDGVIGNMMEGVVYPDMRDLSTLPPKDDWKVTKRNADGTPRVFSSYFEPVELMEEVNLQLTAMYDGWKETESRVEEYRMDGDTEIVLVAYGTSARIAESLVDTLRDEGVQAGLIRPITLFPFPEDSIARLDPKVVKKIITLEMSNPAQLIDDVKAFAPREIPVEHFGRSGGVIMTPEEALRAVRGMIGVRDMILVEA